MEGASSATPLFFAWLLALQLLPVATYLYCFLGSSHLKALVAAFLGAGNTRQDFLL